MLTKEFDVWSHKQPSLRGESKGKKGRDGVVWEEQGRERKIRLTQGLVPPAGGRKKEEEATGRKKGQEGKKFRGRGQLARDGCFGVRGISIQEECFSSREPGLIPNDVEKTLLIGIHWNERSTIRAFYKSL